MSTNNYNNNNYNIEENSLVFSNKDLKFSYSQRKYPNGYLSPNGKLYPCDFQNFHICCKEIIHRYLFDKYKYIDGNYFKEKPDGMLQEEYYLLKYEHFIKITSNKSDIYNPKTSSYILIESILTYYYDFTNNQKEFIDAEDQILNSENQILNQENQILNSEINE